MGLGMGVLNARTGLSWITRTIAAKLGDGTEVKKLPNEEVKR